MRLLFLTLALLANFALAKPLQEDKSIIKGTLPNGFSYTIKKNAYPKQNAEFRLLVKAGSLEEDDDQRGIAHLVEHMAFNGTKHFEKNSLISFLESIGVAFGSHLNASTGTERTMYQLSVPLKNDNLEKSFLVFEDWAGGVVFSKEELEKERGVVLEEARSRDNAGFRIYQQSKGYFYGGSKYEHRTPIGDLDTIKNISIERVKAFYDDWYQPRFMHFVAVGDFDEKKVEQLVKKHFASLKNNGKRKLASRHIPFKKRQKIAFVHDKELTSNSLSLYFFEDKNQRTKTEAQYKKELVRVIAQKLFNLKAAETLYKSNPATTSLRLSSRPMGENLRGYTFSASYQGFKELPALEELADVMFSVEKFGFNKKDFELALKDFYAENEDSFKERLTRESGRYAAVFVNDALYDTPHIDETYEYELVKRLLSEVSLQEVNALIKNILSLEDKLFLYTLSSPQPVAKRKVLASLKKAKKNVKEEQNTLALPKKLLKEELAQKAFKQKLYNKEFDFTEYTLANGIKVAFKQTPYQKNFVSMNAFSKGGLASKPQNMLASTSQVANIIAKSGVDEYNAIELGKIYAGKKFRIRPYISRYTEGFSGSASTKDFGSMLELLYLYNTSYKVNDNILANVKQIALYNLKEFERDPKRKFSREFLEFYYQKNPRYMQHSKEDINAISKEDILNIYKESFKDAQNFTYIVVGDIEQKTFEALIQKYLANLKPIQKEEKLLEKPVRPLKGEQHFVRYFNNENISNIALSYTTERPYSFDENFRLLALSDVLKVKLRELVREEKSGVYGVSVSASQSRIPYEKTKIDIAFTCDPARKEELVGYIKATIDSLQKSPVAEHYLNAFKKKKLNAYEQALKTNRFWENKLVQKYYYGDELALLNSYEKNYKALKTQDVLKASKEYFSTKDVLYTELNPKALKPKE